MTKVLLPNYKVWVKNNHLGCTLTSTAYILRYDWNEIPLKNECTKEYYF